MYKVTSSCCEDSCVLTNLYLAQVRASFVSRGLLRRVETSGSVGRVEMGTEMVASAQGRCSICYHKSCPPHQVTFWPTSMRHPSPRELAAPWALLLVRRIHTNSTCTGKVPLFSPGSACMKCHAMHLHAMNPCQQHHHHQITFLPATLG